MRLVLFGVIVLAFATSAADAQDAQTSVRFQPRVSVQSAPPPPLYATASGPTRQIESVAIVRHDAPDVNAKSNDVEVICGMTVIRKTPDADPKMVIKADRNGAAVRKIEPNVCTNRER